MSQNKKVYLLIFAAIFLLFCGIIIYYFIHNRIAADSPYSTDVLRLSRSWDLDSDGQNESIVLVQYKLEDESKSILKVTANGGKEYSLNLTGFENDISFCSNTELVTIDLLKIICIRGYVGAHSENIELVAFLQQNLRPLNFLTSENIKQDHITADVPNFGFTDANNDNLSDFYVDNRNYDKDPTLDILRSYYYFIKDEFVYNYTEQIDVSEQNLNGKIN